LNRALFLAVLIQKAFHNRKAFYFFYQASFLLFDFNLTNFLFNPGITHVIKVGARGIKNIEIIHKDNFRLKQKKPGQMPSFAPEAGLEPAIL